MRLCVAVGCAVVLVLGTSMWGLGVGAVEASSPGRAPGAMKSASLSYKPITFAEVPEWAADDHLAAFETFRKSCERIQAAAAARERSPVVGITKTAPPHPALVSACETSARIPKVTKDSARAFFEANFTPNTVTHKGPQGMVTGYYEPIMEGSRTPKKDTLKATTQAN